jgi:hypothetical protein
MALATGYIMPVTIDNVATKQSFPGTENPRWPNFELYEVAHIKRVTLFLYYKKPILREVAMANLR